jgi:hypothetical protein
VDLDSRACHLLSIGKQSHASQLFDLVICFSLYVITISMGYCLAPEGDKPIAARTAMKRSANKGLQNSYTSWAKGDAQQVLCTVMNTHRPVPLKRPVMNRAVTANGKSVDRPSRIIEMALATLPASKTGFRPMRSLSLPQVYDVMNCAKCALAACHTV